MTAFEPLSQRVGKACTLYTYMLSFHNP